MKKSNIKSDKLNTKSLTTSSNPLLKKIVAIVTIIIALVNMLLLALNKIDVLLFWAILILVAIIAWPIMKRL